MEMRSKIIFLLLGFVMSFSSLEAIAMPSNQLFILGQEKTTLLRKNSELKTKNAELIKLRDKLKKRRNFFGFTALASGIGATTTLTAGIISNKNKTKLDTKISSKKTKVDTANKKKLAEKVEKEKKDNAEKIITKINKVVKENEELTEPANLTKVSYESDKTIEHYENLLKKYEDDYNEAKKNSEPENPEKPKETDAEFKSRDDKYKEVIIARARAETRNEEKANKITFPAKPKKGEPDPTLEELNTALKEYQAVKKYTMIESKTVKMCYGHVLTDLKLEQYDVELTLGQKFTCNKDSVGAKSEPNTPITNNICWIGDENDPLATQNATIKITQEHLNITSDCMDKESKEQEDKTTSYTEIEDYEKMSVPELQKVIIKEKASTSFKNVSNEEVNGETDIAKLRRLANMIRIEKR